MSQSLALIPVVVDLENQPFLKNLLEHFAASLGCGFVGPNARQSGNLAEARAVGLKTVDGLGMLLHQAVPGFTHWGGIAPTVDTALYEIVLAGLAARAAR